MLLHQACLETFGRKAGGLRSIMKDRRNPLWRQLSDMPCMMMQASDLRFIDGHLASFIKTCQQRAIAAFMLDIFLNKPEQWRKALLAYDHYRKHLSKVKMGRIKRSVRVFILERCTAALVLMQKGEA